MATQINSGERDVRLNPLLNPIRDLAKNWDVDVATYLEDYLTELADINITFDGGVTTMNFVEAAMLIQGSACVYSRKVDFLYNLVVQLLELMRCKKNLQRAKENRPNQAQSGESDEDDEQFLAQDNCPVDKNIDMKTGESSNVGRNLLPVLHISFIPLDADERGNVHLYNQKNEILGNKKDYKINAWNVDSETGALLLDSAVLRAGWNLSLHSTLNETVMRTCNNGALSDDDDPGGGCMMEDAADPGPPVTLKESPPPKATEICESPRKYSLRKRDKDLVSATEKARKLWQPLNPHEELPGAQAMRKGKTYVVLKSETARNHGKRKKKGRASTLPVVPINEFIKKQFYTLQCKFPKVLGKLPLFESLKPAILKEFRRRQAMLKAGRMEDGEQVDEELKFEDLFNKDLDDHDAGSDVGFENNDDDLEDHPPILEPSRKSFLGGAGDKPGYEDSSDPYGADRTFVNMMKEYANQCLLEAKGHKQMTESAQRINAWEDKLSSVLQEEEQHVPYDMRVYCTKIIEKFSPQPSKQSMDFSKIVKGETVGEVSRYFLAALQLANNYNVELSCNNDAGGVHSVNKVELTLLSRRQHFEELDDFHAS